MVYVAISVSVAECTVHEPISKLLNVIALTPNSAGCGMMSDMWRINTALSSSVGCNH